MKPTKEDRKAAEVCETQHCAGCDGWNPATQNVDCPGVHVYPERERARRERGVRQQFEKALTSLHWHQDDTGRCPAPTLCKTNLALAAAEALDKEEGT